MENEKQIDESWKDSVAEDKGQTADGCGCGHDHKESCDSGAQAEPELNFLNYVMSLGYQAMIFLGQVPNPMTNQTEKNLKQAKFLIDTLLMLKDKTRGNLLGKEDEFLNGTLHDLEMKYVEMSK